MTFTYAWEVTRDGVPLPSTSGSSSTLNFTPDDNGHYAFRLTVTGSDGSVGSR